MPGDPEECRRAARVHVGHERWEAQLRPIRKTQRSRAVSSQDNVVRARREAAPDVGELAQRNDHIACRGEPVPPHAGRA